VPFEVVDKRLIQNRLFSELSQMFGQEVPLYDRSLAVNRLCNNAACALLSKLHVGLHITDAQRAQSSAERHGAIRIGRPDEFRWITRFFAAFDMVPHNFYDMTDVGVKSQPIIATAFRSVHQPEHRVFTSLLMTDYFDAHTRQRIENVLSTREIFSAQAKQLIQLGEQQGGLSSSDADTLIHQGVESIFRWRGAARDYELYTFLCDSGFKIAADIACFSSHHLNHLTPNTLCMDLYTTAMKLCLGEISQPQFHSRAKLAFTQLAQDADRDWLRLSFKHLSQVDVEGLQAGVVHSADCDALVREMAQAFDTSEYQLSQFHHNGFQEFTEGPPPHTPIFLRQDAYRALTEPVHFQQSNGASIQSTHTARFGEVEQRGYACTPKGRVQYDECLQRADTAREQHSQRASDDFAGSCAAYAQPFEIFPRTLAQLLEQQLVYGLYQPTEKGLALIGSLATSNMHELVAQGCVEVLGIRYEDFLPVSAAGILASNLNQYGTQSTAPRKPTYSQGMLEAIMDRRIVDATVVYAGLEARSLLQTCEQLALMDRIPQAQRVAWEAAQNAYHQMISES